MNYDEKLLTYKKRITYLATQIERLEKKSGMSELDRELSIQNIKLELSQLAIAIDKVKRDIKLDTYKIN